MGLNVKAGGVWKDVSKVHIKLNGAWQTAEKLWGYAAGGWRSAWQNEVVYVNTSNRTAASIHQLMGSPTQPGTYIFENQATISAGSGSYALRTGVFPAGSILRIVNKGYIRGRGGNGGAYNGAGGAGATALYIDYPCELDNSAGYIFGGGGGGGGAQSYSDGNNYARSAGGGGAGVNGGSIGAGTAWLGAGTANQYRTGYSAPTNGTADAGGAGAYHTSYQSGVAFYTTVTGGTGGGPGAAGGAGSAVVVGKNWSQAAYAGGAAGAAIVRNGISISITAGNNTTRIKGSIV